MWGDEVGDLDDASSDSSNDESDRVYDFMVAKTIEQEEYVVARQGFTVQCLITDPYHSLTSAIVCPR